MRRGDDGDKAGRHRWHPLVTGKTPEPRKVRSRLLYGLVMAPHGAPSWLPRATTNKQAAPGRTCLRGTCRHCYQQRVPKPGGEQVTRTEGASHPAVTVPQE